MLNKVFSYLKNIPTKYLFIGGIVLIIISKFTEIKFETIALFFQLISFVLILWGFIRLSNKKIK